MDEMMAKFKDDGGDSVGRCELLVVEARKGDGYVVMKRERCERMGLLSSSSPPLTREERDVGRDHVIESLSVMWGRKRDKVANYVCHRFCQQGTPTRQC